MPDKRRYAENKRKQRMATCMELAQEDKTYIYIPDMLQLPLFLADCAPQSPQKKSKSHNLLIRQAVVTALGFPQKRQLGDLVHLLVDKFQFTERTVIAYGFNLAVQLATSQDHKPWTTEGGLIGIHARDIWRIIDDIEAFRKQMTAAKKGVH